MPTVTAPTPTPTTPRNGQPSSALQVWVDGKLVSQADATVNVFDHGLLYGDGIFEGLRIYNGRVFEAEAHIKRLYESAKAVRLDIAIKPQDWIDAMYATAKANNFNDCYIRAVATRGIGALGISPSPCKTPVCFIICDGLQLYPKELYEKGMALITSSVTRNHHNALSPRIKSLNYLNNIMGKLDAMDAGVHDAIMLNVDGHISEATAANLFFVRNGVLFTPDGSQGILEGVTRNCILRLAKQMGIPTEERIVPRFDAYVADECFLTGTGAEVMPVTEIDRRKVGTGEPGPITRKLIAAFHKLARGE